MNNQERELKKRTHNHGTHTDAGCRPQRLMPIDSKEIKMIQAEDLRFDHNENKILHVGKYKLGKARVPSVSLHELKFPS